MTTLKTSAWKEKYDAYHQLLLITSLINRHIQIIVKDRDYQAVLTCWLFNFMEKIKKYIEHP